MQHFYHQIVINIISIKLFATALDLGAFNSNKLIVHSFEQVITYNKLPNIIDFNSYNYFQKLRLYLVVKLMMIELIDYINIFKEL